MELTEKFRKVFEKATKAKAVHEAVLLTESLDGSFSESFCYGGRTPSGEMLCASVTKLFTTACILKLCEEKELSLSDPLSRFFDERVLSGLHVYKGKEYSFSLTVKNLLFQDSGLPDSTEDANIWNVLKAGDVTETFEQEVERTKRETPLSVPSEGKKAHYSNINFDLLGKVLEKVEGRCLKDIFQDRIFLPLQMTGSRLVVSDSEKIPYAYYKAEKLFRPKLIASSGAAGGCVSTPEDLMKFIKAFFEGKLFLNSVFQSLSVYKRLQACKGPISYGGGYMEIKLGGMLTAFMGKGELIGHCGSTGSFAFYYPQKKLFFVGDLTELEKPALPIRLLLQLAMNSQEEKN